MTRAFTCEECGKKHDGSFGSGRFCSPSCMGRFVGNCGREEYRHKISATLKARVNEDPQYRQELRARLLEGAAKGRETMRKRWLGKAVTLCRDGQKTILDISNGELEEYRKEHKVCEICGRECATGRNLAVDHDHSNNHFRGLLCAKCNMNYDWFLSNESEIKKYKNKNVGELNGKATFS